MTWLEFDVRMQLGGLCVGGVRIFGRGVRKKGGSDEPPPPGYGPDADVVIVRKAIELGEHNDVVIIADDTYYLCITRPVRTSFTWKRNNISSTSMQRSKH